MAFVVFFIQYLIVAVKWKLVELNFFQFVVARSFTADGNLLQPTGGVNRTPSHVTFLVFVRTHVVSHMTLAQGVSARHTIHDSLACVFDLSSTLSSHSSFVSPIFYFIFLILHFFFYVDRFGVKPLVRFRD